MFAKIDSFLGSHNGLSIAQLTDKIEILGFIETANKYQLLDKDGQKWGFMAEKSGGWLGTILRHFLRNRRPMHIVVWNQDKEEVFSLKRPFHFFYSKMNVFHGRHRLGGIRRRFSLLNSRYDILNRNGKSIGQIQSKYHFHKFSILNSRNTEIGAINKQFGSMEREILTDADTFFVSFPSDWGSSDKALLLAAAITIDMDFFEKGSFRKKI